jgi:hypothetical protein
MSKAFRIVQALLVLMLLLLPSAASASGKTGKAPIIRTSLSATSPYAGQEVVLTYTLYFTGDAPQVSDLSNPSLGGLWHSEADPGRYVKSIPVTVDGTVYRSAVIRQYKLAALQSGRFSIAGYRLRCIFPDRENHEAVIAAPAVTLVARALPEPVPEEFSGAVGNFTFTLTADRQILKAGESATLKATVTGSGNIASLGMPVLALPPDLHAGNTVVALKLDSSRPVSSGSRTSSVTIYPEKAGKTAIPPARFIYFDPESARFHTITAGPLTMTVMPRELSAKPVNPDLENGAIPEQQVTPRLSPAMTAIALVLVAAGLFLVARMRSAKGNRKKTPASGMPETAGTPEAIKAALYALIGRKGIPKPESLTRAQLARAMKDQRIPEATCLETEKLLEAIDRLLYSPLSAQEEETGRIREEGMRLLEKLLRL